MQRISVIVPMYNEARHITRTLDSVILAARVAAIDYELIVVDNGSSDDGPQIARRFIDPCCLGPSRRMGAVVLATQADCDNPVQMFQVKT